MGRTVEPADDDDVEDAWEGGGLRGFLRKPSEPWRLSRQHFPSKAGGVPAWLDPVNLPTGQGAKCDVCDEPLQFLLQVYAPVEDGNEAAFHRTLFVFMCTSLACLKQDHLQQQRGDEKRVRSVKVFRSQLPRENSFYSSEPPKDGVEPVLNAGALLCCWCGTWKGDKRCGGCRQTRYCCRSHQMKDWRGDHAAFCRKVQEHETAACGSKNSVSEGGQAEPTVSSVVPLGARLWPEFELFDDSLEPAPDAGAGASDIEEKYEKRKEEGKEFSARDVEDLEESSAEEQHWAAFQAKISELPEQVLWYCRSSEAKPLWPRLEGQPQASDIPACSVCGGERSFEFQILPQLLYFFDVKDTSDSLDWGTIAVYSCEESCTIQGYREEFAWVQPGFT